MTGGGNGMVAAAAILVVMAMMALWDDDDGVQENIFCFIAIDVCMRANERANVCVSVLLDLWHYNQTRNTRIYVSARTKPTLCLFYVFSLMAHSGRSRSSYSD